MTELANPFLQYPETAKLLTPVLQIGLFVGVTVGVFVGLFVGVLVGISVGVVVGIIVGIIVGVTGEVNGGVKGSVGKGVVGGVIGEVNGLTAFTFQVWLMIDSGAIKENNKKKMVWLTTFLFIILPQVFWSGFYDKFELPKILLFLFVIGLVIPYYYRSVKSFTKLDKLILIMLGWLLICSLVNGNPNSFFGQYYRYQGLITMVGYLGWYWLVAKLNRNKILEKLGTIMTVGASLVTLLIFFQKFAGADGRVAGFLGNPNFAGGYLALTSPFINNWWLLGIIGGGIWLTGSRSALIAFGMIIAVKLWQRVLNRRLLVLAGVFCLISGILIYPKREVSSFDQRGVIWQRGIEAIAKKPVFGWGVENFEVAFGSTLKQNDFDLKNIRVDKAHNEWLEMGVAGGVPAMVIYAWLCAEALLRLYRARQVNALLCLVGFLFISAVNVVNINEYLFFYLAVGISSLSTQRDTTGRARASRAPTLR